MKKNIEYQTWGNIARQDATYHVGGVSGWFEKVNSKPTDHGVYAYSQSVILRMINHSLTSRHHLYSCKFISYLVCDFSNQHSGIKVFARNLFKFCGFNDGFGVFLSHETVVFDFTLYWLDKTNLYV